MDGVHDMGGLQGFGLVVTDDGELTAHEPWEVRAQAMMLISGAASRDAIEHLDPAEYLGSSYYVRWLRASEDVLLRRQQIDDDEVRRWMEAFADDSAVMPTSSNPAVVEMIRTMGPHQHQPATDAAFGVGARIRVRRMRPERHHRCPRYVRGALGEIERVLGSDPVPGLTGDDAMSEPCYTVRFSSVDLFGDATADGDPPHAVYIDLWERYLEAAT